VAEKTFGEGLKELSSLVGHGDLEGSVVVDQVYAHYQHVRLDLRHPRGGGPLYLTKPLLKNMDVYFERIARETLNEGPRKGMEWCVEDLAGIGGVATYAPREFGDLRKSGHPSIRDDGALVYDRAPEQHRLSEAELKAKARLRPLPPALLGWIYWHNTVRGKAGLPPERKGGR
jgi:hypothetical protein